MPHNCNTYVNKYEITNIIISKRFPALVITCPLKKKKACFG